MFAKLFGPADAQVVVMLDHEDKGPALKIIFKPAGQGMCSVLMRYRNSDQGRLLALRSFHRLDEAAVRALVDASATAIDGGMSEDAAA